MKMTFLPVKNLMWNGFNDFKIKNINIDTLTLSNTKCDPHHTDYVKKNQKVETKKWFDILCQWTSSLRSIHQSIQQPNSEVVCCAAGCLVARIFINSTCTKYVSKYPCLENLIIIYNPLKYSLQRMNENDTIIHTGWNNAVLSMRSTERENSK